MRAKGTWGGMYRSRGRRQGHHKNRLTALATGFIPAARNTLQLALHHIAWQLTAMPTY